MTYKSLEKIPLVAFEEVSNNVWQIPSSFRLDMQVPARIYATRRMLEDAASDNSFGQLVNLTTLPGIEKYALAMPDIHEGYGSPVGGVAATAIERGGFISPGMIGYDINCGVRLLRTNMTAGELAPHVERVAHQLSRSIPSGVGRGGKLILDDRALDTVLSNGAAQMVQDGYGNPEDLAYLESNGRMPHAGSDFVSKLARDRGRDQLGTMGAGNHFVEVQKVTEIFDDKSASLFGIYKNQVVVMIHTGSRGLGHQIATDYIRVMIGAMAKYSINLPDRELAGARFDSPEGQAYWRAMACAANFAWANRQMITWEVRQAFNYGLGKNIANIDIVYDVAHNIGKREIHKTNGAEHEYLVHRKGATRSFGPEHQEVPEKYRSVGQPVLIPGSMGTSSYVLVGTKKAMQESFGSCCHGAGRSLSRHAAKKVMRGAEIKNELIKRGIVVKTGSISGLAEEAPLAYKDVDNVVDVVDKVGLAKKVARLTPLAVIKG